MGSAEAMRVEPPRKVNALSEETPAGRSPPGELTVTSQAPPCEKELPGCYSSLSEDTDRELHKRNHREQSLQCERISITG